MDTPICMMTPEVNIIDIPSEKWNMCTHFSSTVVPRKHIWSKTNQTSLGITHLTAGQHIPNSHHRFKCLAVGSGMVQETATRRKWFVDVPSQTPFFTCSARRSRNILEKLRLRASLRTPFSSKKFVWRIVCGPGRLKIALSNPKLSEFFGPHRAPERELGELLSYD